MRRRVANTRIKYIRLVVGRAVRIFCIGVRDLCSVIHDTRNNSIDFCYLISRFVAVGVIRNICRFASSFMSEYQQFFEIGYVL
jgi:hypothetical protein